MMNSTSDHDKQGGASAQAGDDDSGQACGHESGRKPHKRRVRLAELRADALRAQQEAGLTGAQDEDPELTAFLDDLVDKKARRKAQLALVRGFFTDPLRFGAGLKTITGDDAALDPAQRRDFLEDQIALLSGILEAAEAELELLDSALKSIDSAEQDNAPS